MFETMTEVYNGEQYAVLGQSHEQQFAASERFTQAQHLAGVFVAESRVWHCKI
jgi:hypothetical protein